MFLPNIFFLLYPNTLSIDFDVLIIIPKLAYLIEHSIVHELA